MWHGRGHSYGYTYENVHYAACGMAGGQLYGCTYENVHNAICGMLGGHSYDCTYENAHMRNLSRVWRPGFGWDPIQRNFGNWIEDGNIKWPDVNCLEDLIIPIS
jgi:hypothetical protein